MKNNIEIAQLIKSNQSFNLCLAFELMKGEKISIEEKTKIFVKNLPYAEFTENDQYNTYCWLFRLDFIQNIYELTIFMNRDIDRQKRIFTSQLDIINSESGYKKLIWKNSRKLKGIVIRNIKQDAFKIALENYENQN